MGFLDFLLTPLRESTEEAVHQCKEKPGKCARQLLLDGLVIVLAYAFLLYVVEGKVLAWVRGVKFYVLFLFVAFVLRYLDVDFQDQLTRVAGFQLGTKLFAAMATV
jgi:hypothetical protein